MPISMFWVRDLALVFALLTSPLTDDAQEYVPMSLLGYVTHFQGVVPVFIYKFLNKLLPNVLLKYVSFKDVRY